MAPASSTKQYRETHILDFDYAKLSMNFKNQTSVRKTICLVVMVQKTFNSTGTLLFSLHIGTHTFLLFRIQFFSTFAKYAQSLLLEDRFSHQIRVLLPSSLPCSEVNQSMIEYATNICTPRLE